MEQVYVFFIRNDVWIYILCGLGLFWYGSELLRARQMLRRAMFNLERERGQRLRNSALVFVLALLGIAGSVAYVNVKIAPTLPADLLRAPTPTLDPFNMPLSSPTPVINTPRPVNTPTPPLAPTVTLPAEVIQAVRTVGSGSVQATAVVTGTLPALGETPLPPTTTVEAAGNCPATVNFSAPAADSFVSGLVAFRGTATGENFGFYRLEVNGPETGYVWASLLGRTMAQPVSEGLLGSANFDGWLPGVYQVRLVVVDNTSNEQGSCTIGINVN
ncbi:MAG: hypothetical protein Fur0021_32240 [Candidatus Promineifilaceae bacterium]